MKKLIFSLSAVLFLSTAFVSAQSLDEVLENYFEVIGQEKLLEAKSSQTTGKMIQMGLEIPFKQYSAYPSNFRIEATMQDMTLIQVYNGKEGWMLNPFAGQTEPVPMGPDELKSVKVQADYEGLLWNWGDKGYKVSLEENEEVEGVDCYVVKAISPDGDEFTIYIDVDSYVTIKNRNKVKMQGQEIVSETFMSNYQEGDGFVYAGKIETRQNGQVSTIVIDTMTLGVDLAEGFFDKPGK